MLTCTKCNKLYADKFETCPHCSGKKVIKRLVVVGIMLTVAALGLFSEQGEKPAGADSVTPAQFEAAKASLAKALQDPQKAKLMACQGIQVYRDPQPPGFPPSAAECAQIEQQAGLRPAEAAADQPASPSASERTEDPPIDPYATGQKALGDAAYAQSKAELLDQVRVAQFAYRCRVIAEIEANMIYMSGVRRISERELASGRSDYHPDLLPDAKAAAVEADSNAKKPGACDYWQQNPEAVAEIRQLAQLALMR